MPGGPAAEISSPLLSAAPSPRAMPMPEAEPEKFSDVGWFSRVLARIARAATSGGAELRTNTGDTVGVLIAPQPEQMRWLR
jgi:hypothetical protein